jgi:succinate dehydrogenase/fumarate reductase flavoprotein subunit
MWQTTGVEGDRGPRAVVVGSGLAGLVSALELAAEGWCVEVLSAGRAGRDGATHRVHALAPWVLLTSPCVRGDGPDAFLADLKGRGRGLEREGLAEVLAAEAHAAARELVEMLDLVPVDPGPVTLPGDTHPRGLRCLPRARHVMLAPLLTRCARAGVHVRERTLVVGLRVREGRVTGVVALGRGSGELVEIAADAVLFACGGSGRVFPVATGPRWCRGSGLALGSAAGVLLHRPELTQALPVTATPPLHFFPTSAALLAGRIDVGGRTVPQGLDLDATTIEIAKALQGGAKAFLEPAEGGGALLPDRVRECAMFRSEGRVALTVASHHGIGGVAIDSWGRTSLTGLYACGEAAGGVQGRRRIMGTGLLEALIFGRRAARAACRDAVRLGPALSGGELKSPPIPADPAACERALDALLGPLVAWRPAGAVTAAVSEIGRWSVSAFNGVDERGALAGIRRQAALAILSSEQTKSQATGSSPPASVAAGGV